MEEITIEKMVFGGHGLARTGSGVLFVENGLPGEIIQVVTESKKHDCIVARPVKIIKRSDLRREPPCKYAGECGGCDWLFIEYPGQLQFKKDIFLDCLRRIGKLDCLPEPEVFGSPEFNYRIRAQVKFDKAGKFGFYRKKTNDIVSIQQCPLLCNEINELLKVAKGKELISKGSLRIIAGNDGMTSDPVIPGLTQRKTNIKVGDKIFEVTGESFFQSNRYLLDIMGKWALPYVGGQMVVDLYGGTGFLSVMLSGNFKNGLLIESIKEQVVTAKRNYTLNGLGHFEAIHLPAERVKDAVTKKPDLLIIDPPRPGLTAKARDEVVSLDAKKILYISCNPSTQARDIGFFVKHGFAVEKMAVFDMYPNTYHVETGVLLGR